MDDVRRSGMIANVPLRLLYLNLSAGAWLILLMGRPSSTKDVELLVLARGLRPAPHQPETTHGLG